MKKTNYWWILGLILPPVGIVLYFLWKNKRKDDSKSIGTGAIISSVLWLMIGLSFIPAKETSKDNTNVLKEVDVSLAGKEVSEWYKDAANGEVVVTVIASSTCPHCKNLRPVIEASAKKNKYKLYFFEVDLLSEDDYLLITNSINLDGYEGYVPFTFVIKDKKYQGSKTGEMTDELLKQFLIDTNVLEG